MALDAVTTEELAHAPPADEAERTEPTVMEHLEAGGPAEISNDPEASDAADGARSAAAAEGKPEAPEAEVTAEPEAAATEEPAEAEAAATKEPAEAEAAATKEGTAPASERASGRGRPPRDRGRAVAFGVLGGLVLLGLGLIIRGPEKPAGPAGASTLTAADVGSAAPSASASASEETKGASAAGDAGAAPAEPAAPKFVPTWRVAALKSDTSIEVLEGTLGKRKLEGALVTTGLSRAEAKRVVHAIDGVRRIEKGQPKDTFVIARDRAKGTVVAFEYATSKTDVWQLKADESSADKRLAMKKLELFVEHKKHVAALQITADLAKAIAAAGLQEDAASAIDDALEGHVDLATIGIGARMRVVGSEEWVEGVYSRYQVDALEYVPSPKEKNATTLRVYHYEREPAEGATRRRSSHAGFYDAKGQQPYKGQFRSPLPLARVTSRFNPKRMHPVLHVVMPHNGVDFGASTGTPVYASAAGVVSTAGDSGPCGNMVQVDHAGGLSTAYCHLSKFAPGIHPGQHVEARQLVGYVGQTGRATGPHLHFAVKRGGNFIDPLAIKMDGVRTLPSADREAFAKQRAALDSALDAVTLPTSDASTTPASEEEKDEPSGEE
ncbi:MAG: M23 family metallopeptidase [Deltaproteobacteria bacterium]|nr:M23 family metallopeptidase [Deltaproteobacteria bacterium]